MKATEATGEKISPLPVVKTCFSPSTSLANRSACTIDARDDDIGTGGPNPGKTLSVRHVSIADQDSTRRPCLGPPEAESKARQDRSIRETCLPV